MVASTALSASSGSKVAVGMSGKAAASVVSFFTPSGKTGTMLSRHPVLGGLGLEAEMERALGEDLDEGKAAAGDLQFERLLDGALGVGPSPVVIERDPLDIDGPVQAGDQLRHLQRLTGQERPALRRGASFAGR